MERPRRDLAALGARASVEYLCQPRQAGAVRGRWHDFFSNLDAANHAARRGRGARRRIVAAPTAGGRRGAVAEHHPDSDRRHAGRRSALHAPGPTLARRAGHVVFPLFRDDAALLPVPVVDLSRPVRAQPRRARQHRRRRRLHDLFHRRPRAIDGRDLAARRWLPHGVVRQISERLRRISRSDPRAARLGTAGRPESTTLHTANSTTG
jgi:hypothetical protein